MLSVSACPIPDNTLLSIYAVDDTAYADCYRSNINARVSHTQFVTTFYTTWLFKLERLILQMIVSKPSSDEQARLLAEGVTDTFAAWRVEGRSEHELLMCDYRGRTRSWFMIEQSGVDGDPRTSLYFGSAVVPVTNRKSGRRQLGLMVYLMLGFHKLYSRALLLAATARLAALHA